jgi:hypothetical protein
MQAMAIQTLSVVYCIKQVKPFGLKIGFLPPSGKRLLSFCPYFASQVKKLTFQDLTPLPARKAQVRPTLFEQPH